MSSLPAHTDQKRMEPSPVMQLPLAITPLRTLSKGTLDMIAADVKRGSFTPPPGGPPPVQTTGEQRALGESNSTLLRFDSELNQLRPIEKSLSSVSQTVTAAQLSRNNSIDVPAAVAAAERASAERAALSKQADSSNVVLNDAIMRRNKFITLQANYAAKAEELKRSQDEHLELTMAHMEVQRKAEQLAKQVDESEAAVKAAEEQARQADVLWKNVIDREKKQSEMTTMLPMEEVQRVFDQNDGNAAGVSAVYESDAAAALTPTKSMSFRQGQVGSADMSSYFERTRSFQSAVAIDEEIKRIQNRQSFHQGRLPNASNSNTIKDKIQRDLSASQSAQDARNKTTTGVKRPPSAIVSNPAGNTKQQKIQPKSLPTKPVTIYATPHDASDKPRLECRNCGRVNTPQWRIGPDGPKTLCNACGVHYRKFKTLPLFQIKFNEPPPKAS